MLILPVLTAQRDRSICVLQLKTGYLEKCACMEGQCVVGGKYCSSSTMLVNLFFFKNLKCIHIELFKDTKNEEK